jgi:hypothetical protein
LGRNLEFNQSKAKDLIVTHRRSVLEFLLIITLSIQFLFNSRVGDDWPNSNTPSYIAWRYGKITLTTLWNEMSYWIAAWANGQGRFFPMAVIQTQLVFTFFRTQASVRIFYALVFIVFALIWVSLIRRISKNPLTGTYFLIVLSFTIQFRRDFEPHIGFAQLLIWSSIWLALSAHSLITALEASSNKSKAFYSSLAGILFFIGVCQYELTFLMLPMFPLIAVLNLRLRGQTTFRDLHAIRFILRFLAPILAAAFAYAAIVFGYLRPKANPDGAYVTGFDLLNSSRAFGIQFIAAFPTMGHKFSETFKLPTNFTYVILVALATFCFYLVLRQLIRLKQAIKIEEHLDRQSSQFKHSVLFLLGLYFICVPSLMISLQPAWWSRLEFGSTYLGVLFGELGIAIAVASILTSVDEKRILRLLSNQKKKMKHIYRESTFATSTMFKAIVVLLVFTTLLSNFRMIEGTKNRDNLSAAWAGITDEKTFFQDLNDRDFLFSTTFNDAYEINVANIYVRTGIRLAQVFYPPFVWSDFLECQQYDSCKLENIREKSAATLVNHSRGEYAIAKLTRQKGFEGDWPSILSKPRALASSSFWYFNIFMMTQSTALAYLVPMVDDPENALSIPSKAIVYTMVMDDSPVITPAFMGICLKPSTDPDKEPVLVGGVKILKWQLPSVYLSPSGQVIDLEDKVDIRRVVTGSC